MASKESIEMDFQKALQSAERLEEAASAMKQTAQGIFADSLTATKAAWQSESSELFLQKGMKVNQAMICTSQNLSKIAEDIRTDAKRIYIAEMQALIMVRNRKY